MNVSVNNPNNGGIAVEKQPVLLMSRVVTNPNGSVERYVSNYDGQKIIQETNETTKDKVLFLYSGDNIIKLINQYSTIEFTYDGEEKLIRKLTTLQSGEQIDEIYTHIDNKTIQSVKTENGEKFNNTYNLRDNGDVSSVITTKEDNSYTNIINYTYGNAHNPRKNIKGLHKLMLPYSPKSNIIQEWISTTTKDSNGHSHFTQSVKKYEYKLNADNYPVEMYITEGSKETKEVYQYNQ